MRHTDHSFGEGYPIQSEISPEKDPTLRAREIARQAGFEYALRTLREQDLLAREVARVKALYERQLFDAESFMTEAIWEAFTVIELFHPETADHCAETYRLARGKVERQLFGSKVHFAELFDEERITLPVFYRACLLHDIGKVDIPYDLIANTVTDEECAYLLNLHQDDALVHAALARNHVSETADPEALVRALMMTGRRPKDIAPATLLLPPRTVDALVKQGIDANQTLAELIRPHEEHSASILSALGFPKESDLAARHHNYRNLPVETPIAVGGLGVSVDVAEILHLADVEQAMRAQRGYKPSSTALEAMVTLIRHAERGIVHTDITSVWVRDEVERLYPDEAAFEKAMQDPAESAHLATIAAFLEEHSLVHLGNRAIAVSAPSVRSV